MSSVRRVPPPPPPGFGDDEYYRLYGRPEDYHRYRARVERELRRRGRGPASRSRSLEPGEAPDDDDDDDDLSEDDETELSELEEEERAPTPPRDLRYHPRISRRRHPPPPPADFYYEDRYAPRSPPPFEDDHRSRPPPRRRYPPPPPAEFLAGERRDRSRSRAEISSDLSSLEDVELSPSPRSRKGARGGRQAFENFRVTIPNKKDRVSRVPPSAPESEGSLSLSDVDEAMSEGVEQPVEKSRRSTPPKVPYMKVRSAKERLGKRVLPPPVEISSEDEPPPSPKKSPDNPPRSKKKSPLRTESRRRPRTPSPERPKSRKAREDTEKKRPPESRSRPTSPSCRTKQKRKRKRNRTRNRPPNLSQRMEDTNKENEAMMRRLARKRKGPVTSESNQVKNLARMAGLKIPKGAATSDVSSSKRVRRRGEASLSPEDKGRGGRGLGSKLRSDRMRSGAKKRSPSPERGRKRSSKRGSRSPKRWKHDKFTEASPVREDHSNEDERGFGSHWSRIRSERSKERDRDGKIRRTRSRSRGKKQRHSRRSYSSSSGSSRSSSGSSRSSIGRRKGRRRNRRRSYSSYSSRSSRSSSYSSGSSSSRSSRSRSVSPIPHPRRARKGNQSRSLLTSALAPPRTPPPSAAKVQSTGTEKEGVNLQTSGKLLQDTNLVNGVVVKYSEPPEARKPRTKWRLYVFKGSEELPILYIHRQSSYLMGRDRKVADVPLDHPSCSKQHGVLQYRLVDFRRPDGTAGRRVTPYVMDLSSANGTFLNNQKIESQKYVQVMEKDVLKFGFSSREYVLLHDQSKDAEEDDPGVE